MIKTQHIYYKIRKMKQTIKQILREGLIREQRIKFDIPIPDDIKKIKDVFKKNGHKLYVVGGAVRDALLGKTPKDYDLATDAVPDKVEEMMKKAKLKTLPTGKAFGVINVFTNEGEYEIATFREDIGSGRRPDVKIGATIESDAARRDLRVNALYYDIDTNEIIDLVGGLDDLKNNTINMVGNPQERFEEDPLRILRFFRFYSRFN
jgi:tRNA nucleotidyltransferase/poly(A) polymerase